MLARMRVIERPTTPLLRSSKPASAKPAAATALQTPQLGWAPRANRAGATAPVERAAAPDGKKFCEAAVRDDTPVFRK